MELSRKNRALSAELVSEQNKVKQLEDKLKELTSEQFQQSNIQQLSTISSLPSSDCDDVDIKVSIICVILIVIMYDNRELLHLKNS